MRRADYLCVKSLNSREPTDLQFATLRAATFGATIRRCMPFAVSYLGRPWIFSIGTTEMIGGSMWHFRNTFFKAQAYNCCAGREDKPFQRSR